MCKIFAVAGLKNKDAELDQFAKAILPYMTAGDNDAVGYAAFSDELFGERWLNTELALTKQTSRPLHSKTNPRLVYEPQSNKFGDTTPVNPVKAMILHSRYATCGKGLANTHPFVSEDGKTALIHNGVVQTRGLDLRTSTCDSEGILNAYTDVDVSNTHGNIQTVFNRVKGAFACAVLTEDNIGDKYLDLFRNDQYPTLYACYVDQLDATVYCTEAYMIENALKDLGWTSETMMKVLDNSYLRIDAVTGEVLVNMEVKREIVRRIAAKSKKKGKKK